MATGSSKWIVRSKNGQILGPFLTEKIIELIRQGKLTEDDQIALYPSHQWHKVSHNPQFYDVLLDLLADSKEPPPFKESEEPEESAQEQKSEPIKSEPEEGDVVIELSPMEEVAKKEKFRRAKWPAFVMLGSAISLIIYLVIPQQGFDDRIQLMAPQEARKMSANQANAKLKSAIEAYVLDSFKNYLRAQNDFVQVIEAQPKNVKAMALLCMTYLELWPYAKQDSADLRAIAKVMQMSAKLDPAGPQGNTCRVVQDFINNHNEEALATVEGVLSSLTDNSSPPVNFYYFKALSLEKLRSYQPALGYLTSAQQLWPQWLKPYFLEARIQEEMNNAAAASTRYRQILQINPKHKMALIRLGLIEHRQFFRYAEGKAALKKALSMEERAPLNQISAAYMSLAEIALYENDESLALEYAQKAYSSFSANNAAKNLIIKLGGVEKLNKTNVKGDQLVYEGDQFEREGDCNAAQAHYKAAFERNPKNGVAALKAARCLWRLSFSTEAIDWLNRAIKADPQLVESYITLADYYSRRYNFEAAGAILQKAHSLNSKNFEVYRGYALVELRRRNYGGAINYAKQAVALHEADVDTYIIMAEAYLKMSKYTEAYNIANRAIELDPNNRKGRVTYARALAGVQGVESGLDYLSRLVAQYPVVVDYRLALGRMYAEDERYSEAQKVFLQVIEMDPKPKEALIELGRVLRRQSALEPALESFLRAAVLDPADADPLFEAGVMYLQIKKPQQALEQLRRVEKINPLYPLVYYYMGRASLLAGKAAEAIEYAEKERQANPKLAESYILAAEAYTQQKQYSLCAKEYQKAIQIQSPGAQIYVKLASCYRRAGNLDVAMAMLNQAAARESGLPDIYREQGQVYEMNGDYNRAIEAYNQYLALNPTGADVAQIRNKIISLGSR